jgi:hypothetical protein
MLLRLIVVTNDARGARSLKLSPLRLTLALLAAVCAVASALWLGWKISAFAGPGAL